MAGSTVLVVDDDKLTRFSLSKILERAGYRTQETASAAEALAAIEADPPRLVLLDIRLPDRDGFSVLQAIRANHPRLPVIMMTAHHTEDSTREANARGASGYLGKPCDPVELQSVISAILGSPCATDNA